MKKAQEFTREDVTEEGTKLTASLDVNPELRDAITNPDGGLMTAGALPALTISSTAGNKTLLDAVEKARVAMLELMCLYLNLNQFPNSFLFRGVFVLNIV